MVGQTTTQMLRHARMAERPIRRSDGRWILKDVCAAACAVALDHVLVGLENDADRKDSLCSCSNMTRPSKLISFGSLAINPFASKPLLTHSSSRQVPIALTISFTRGRFENEHADRRTRGTAQINTLCAVEALRILATPATEDDEDIRNFAQEVCSNSYASQRNS